MDLEKNKQRIEILAAEIEELKNGGGGGGDLSAYLTKDEASSTYETQSAASSALALKADKSTTYTKTEVDEAIAAAGGDLDLTPIAITLDNGLFPEDKLSVIQKHLPISINGTNLIFIGSSGSTGYIYGSFYGYTLEDGLAIQKVYIINSTSRSVKSWGVGGNVGNFVEIVCGQNFSKYLFAPSRWQQSTNTNGKPVNLWTSANLNNVYTIGLYYCTSAVAATLTNCPTTNAFILINGNWRNQSGTAQTIIEQSGSAIYMRQSLSGSWHKFSADVETATSTETLPSAGTGTTFDTGIEWTYIQTKKDFILDSEGTQIKFRYGFTKGSYLHYFGYTNSPSGIILIHLELGAPTGSGTTALANWISSGAIPTT